jgi:hypothetical protein
MWTFTGYSRCSSSKCPDVKLQIEDCTMKHWNSAKQTNASICVAVKGFRRLLVPRCLLRVVRPAHTQKYSGHRVRGNPESSKNLHCCIPVCLVMANNRVRPSWYSCARFQAVFSHHFSHGKHECSRKKMKVLLCELRHSLHQLLLSSNLQCMKTLVGIPASQEEGTDMRVLANTKLISVTGCRNRGYIPNRGL